MTAPLRVLVADDDELLRETLVEVLLHDGRFDVVAAVADADAAVDAATREHPAVALVDVRMPGGGGARVARELRTTLPSTRVVALSSHDDRDAIVEMFRSGAVSYLVKGDATNQDIITALIDVSEGRFTLPSSVGRQVLDELSTQLERAHAHEGQHRARESRVRRVLASGELEVVFQPIFSLSDGQRVGAEALSRFHHVPRQGPDRWFADAATVGLGVQLELLAVRCALAEFDAVTGDGYLALNVSPTTAADLDFQALVLGSTPDCIVMEITEHAPIDDYDDFRRSIEEVRSAGVRLAIDDAGAGFASLRHIVSLDPDIIKLDISLTQHIDAHRPRRAMARALITFAAESGASIVAEGIETQAECDTLRHLGVSTGQGYLLARPGPVDAMPAACDLQGR